MWSTRPTMGLMVVGWVGLVGVVAGAAIALFGQHNLRRLDRRDGDAGLMLEQCATVLALSEDYRNRVWEERLLGARDAVEAWDLREYRMAEARLRVLSADQSLLDALAAVGNAGQRLGKLWRVAPEEGDALDTAWVAYKVAVHNFEASARNALRRSALCRRLIGR